MKLMIMSTMISSALSFILTKHPLSMGLILLLQTLLTAMLVSSISLYPWFSFILFMIMIGGMLVLFIYMTSVASNEKFSISPKIILLWTTMLFIIPMTTSNHLLILLFHSSKETKALFKNIQLNEMTKFFESPSTTLLISLMAYLFVALIAATNISKTSHGPLREN